MKEMYSKGEITMRQIGRKGLLWLLTGILLICPAFAASAFPDVDENAEYADAVACVSEIGIMVGDEQGNFNPNKTVTRAEMATIICNMLGETEGLTASVVFWDVPTSHWANKYISKAAELGIVSGYGNGLFGASDNVTYGQAITMIVRAIGEGEVAVLRGGYPEGFLAVAEEQGLLAGIHSETGEAISRSDVAMILFNYYNAEIPV